MTALADVLGMCLPGTSSIPAADGNHMRMCSAAGRRIVDMVWEDLTPTGIMTDGRLPQRHQGGDGDGLLDQRGDAHARHGAARRANIGLEDFDAASRKVPVIANIRPSGDKYLMEDFYYAGGLLGLMSRLKGVARPHADQRQGETWAESLEGATVYNDDVIRPLDNAIYQEGALALLKGNLAPDGCVIKPSRLRAALLEAHRPATGVRQLRGAEDEHQPRGSRRHRRHKCWCCAMPGRRAAPACRNGACCRSRPSS